MRIRRTLLVGALLWASLSAGLFAADDPPVPPAPAQGGQWGFAVLPDSQGYNQTYDMGGKFTGRGYQYKGRFAQQIEWIVKNRDVYNIRLAASMGDHVQNFGFDEAAADADPKSKDALKRGEWLNAVDGLNRFHVDGDPEKPALVPYAAAIGNHDYSRSQVGSLVSTEYERFMGPGRFLAADGRVKPAFADWYKGTDKGWEYRVDGRLLATGAGRNNWQSFKAGERTFLHLTLECAVPDSAVAWAKEVIAANPGMPVILTTHTFIGGGGELRDRNGMGRKVDGPDPTNGAQEIFDKLIRDEDRIFMVLCGHCWAHPHVVMKNAAGHDVHVLEMCYHLQRVGGRIDPAELPPESPFKGPMDKDRNGSGWLGLMMFDPAAKTITWYTYSPVIDVWAVDRPKDYQGTTYPVGDTIVERWDFDFDARFGPAR